jgi:hypothetical protein
MELSNTACSSGISVDDHGYEEFLSIQQKHFENVVKEYGGVLFTTELHNEPDVLFNIFLSKLPVELRQYYNCNCCRSYFKKFGGLVVITKEGHTIPAVWTTKGIPGVFVLSVVNVVNAVVNSKVTGVFLSGQQIWGTPVTGTWTHFYVAPYRSLVYRSVLKNAGQAIAEKREDYNTLCRSLSEYSYNTIEKAIQLLKSDTLYRSEKVLGPARWLEHLADLRNTFHGRVRDNVTWLAVATAPPGFCHPKSSMIGTLLDDLESGLDFSEVQAKFKDKMNPLLYQRPQVNPTVGNVEKAEEIVEKLGIADSLHRRFACLEDLKTLWVPRKNNTSTKSGVFSDVATKNSRNNNCSSSNIQTSNVTITWEKFRRTVLPEAETIEFYTKYGLDDYAAYVTAVHSDAPPILQWDSLENRNPVSCYVYHNGSYCTQWGLATDTYVPVTAVTLRPHMWFGEDKFNHQISGVLFVLEGAKDRNCTELALFPEILKSELREIRSTIEAFSKTRKIEGVYNASACGIMITNRCKGKTFRVVSKGVVTCYCIDRWD